jgi:hypothetical protein
VVGLGEAEAADEFAGGELGQLFAALRLAAIGIDRVHDQRRLHRHRRAESGIDASGMVEPRRPSAPISRTTTGSYFSSRKAVSTRGNSLSCA